MSTMTFEGIELPPVYEENRSDIIIGQRERTANGTMRQDITAIKEVIEVSCRVASPEEANAFLNNIKDNFYTSGELIITGTNTNDTLTVYPGEVSIDRVQFTDKDGVYHNDGREITISFEEV